MTESQQTQVKRQGRLIQCLNLGSILFVSHYPLFLIMGHTEYAQCVAFQVRWIGAAFIFLGVGRKIEALYCFGISLCFMSDFVKLPFYVNQKMGVYVLSITIVILTIWNYVRRLYR